MSRSKTIDASKNRLISLDALRGFNMFWIIGAERIAHLLQKMAVPGTQSLAAQFTHSRWNGFTFYDLIFPMFVFIVGISAVFSVMRHREQGTANRVILIHIFSRTVKLFLLGIVVSNINFNLFSGWENLRWLGVLQRIALCYCIAAIFILYCKPRWQAFTTATILLGYWSLLQFVPVPGFEAATLNYPGANLTNYLDNHYLPGRLYYESWDPEGILSTLPALATCFCGVASGYWLKCKTTLYLEHSSLIGRLTKVFPVKLPFGGRQIEITKERKAMVLALGGLVLIGLGLLWGMVFPINKKIWTSSFALLTGGLSAICLAVFYWLIEICDLKKWAFPFVVIGSNPILIYLLANLIPFRSIADWLIKNQYLVSWGDWRYLLSLLTVMLFEWLIIYCMYHRKIYLKL